MQYGVFRKKTRVIVNILLMQITSSHMLNVQIWIPCFRICCPFFKDVQLSLVLAIENQPSSFSTRLHTLPFLQIKLTKVNTCLQIRFWKFSFIFTDNCNVVLGTYMFMLLCSALFYNDTHLSLCLWEELHVFVTIGKQSELFSHTALN